jgi:hypothetical protein
MAVTAAELVPRVIVNRAIIERQGVLPDDATRLALVPSIISVPFVQSVLIASAIGRNAAPVDVPDEEAAPVGVTPTTTEPTPVKVPKLAGLDLKAALDALSAVGLQSRHVGPSTGVVIEQQPPAGATISSDGEVLIVLGPEASEAASSGGKLPTKH